MQADNNINDFENKVEFIYYHITNMELIMLAVILT